MTRSKRKTLIFGIAGDSEKEDKKRWHKNIRRAEKQHLKCLDDLEGHMPLLPNEVISTWDMAKDGKWYMTDELKRRQWHRDKLWKYKFK